MPRSVRGELQQAAVYLSEYGVDKEWRALTRHGRVDVAELFCSPASVLVAECQRQGGTGIRIGFSTGLDLSTRHGISKAKEILTQAHPVRPGSHSHVRHGAGSRTSRRTRTRCTRRGSAASASSARRSRWWTIAIP